MTKQKELNGDDPIKKYFSKYKKRYVMSAEDPTEATRCDVTLLKQCNRTWHHQVSKKKAQTFYF